MGQAKQAIARDSELENVLPEDSFALIHSKGIRFFDQSLSLLVTPVSSNTAKCHSSDKILSFFFLLQVEGLPGLILCSGIVVAAGREPFRPANYNTQKSPAPTVLKTNRLGLRRPKAFTRKFTLESRYFFKILIVLITSFRMYSHLLDELVFTACQCACSNLSGLMG